MRLLRELGRRKLRTALTIGGITIGIWALVVFSSMANKITALVEGGSEYYADKVIVSDEATFGTAPMSLGSGDEIAAVSGVDAVDAQVQLFFEEDFSGASMGVPDLVIGAVPGADGGNEDFVLEMADGRLLTADDTGNLVVLGSDLARKHAVGVGDNLEIHSTDFEVVGVLQPTLTAPDVTALVPLSAAQELYVATLPPLFADALPVEDLVNSIVVYPEAGADVDTVAAAIGDRVAGARTMTGEEFDAQIGSATAIFNAIIIGVAVISLVVGGLSVINTMAMAVAERTREIGIKRAIGGARGRIIRELVTEAGAIGLLGGVIGLGLGTLVVAVANEAGRSSGTVLFDLNAGTAIFAVVFSTILGMLAGIIPAWSAARLDPVSALRYE